MITNQSRIVTSYERERIAPRHHDFLTLSFWLRILTAGQSNARPNLAHAGTAWLAPFAVALARVTRHVSSGERPNERSIKPADRGLSCQTGRTSRPASVALSSRRMPKWSLAACLLCGCAPAPPRSPPPTAEPASPRSPETLATAQVYDETGEARACDTPKKICPDSPKNAKFLDKCRLRGYQVRRCGCEELCSGNAMVFKPHYDQDGNAKECTDEDPSCTPPNTSAAFQDACTDAHHRLVICGCEWLCSGEPKYPPAGE